MRVLLAKPGLDGHDRGARVVARALREAGVEVIYTGLHQSGEQIVQAALQEDVDVVGLSILSGAHLSLTEEIIALMGQAEVADVPLVLGGIIPDEDRQRLLAAGVAAIFGPGTPLPDIVRAVLQLGGKVR
ncbi:MAG TPA: cobalamin B12-binding domain-containing protein [Symbiobacteriaceae bacterium]|nr:cobalamin B12-binding domain-containing protein [Symbiobacteriaceae bacterium]